jgi:hypothetical protein
MVEAAGEGLTAPIANSLGQRSGELRRRPVATFLRPAKGMIPAEAKSRLRVCKRLLQPSPKNGPKTG